MSVSSTAASMVAAVGGSHSHDDVHAVGHEIGADLVQVGLVGLRIGVVVA